MQECIARHFTVAVYNGISIKNKVVIGSNTPKLNVIAAGLTPISQKFVFILVNQFAFVSRIRCKSRNRKTHAFQRFPDATAIFPKRHTRVLHISIDFMIARKLLQNNAIELPHPREAKNKNRKVAIVMKFRLAIFILTRFIQIRQRQVGYILAFLFR